MSTPFLQQSLFEPRAEFSGPLVTASTLDPQAQGERTAVIQIYQSIANPSFWSSGFGEGAARQAVREIKAAHQGAGLDAIQLRIHSRGGSAFIGLFAAGLFKRTAKELGIRLETVCDGLALSIASVMLMAGERRTMAKTGFVMIHSAWANIGGNADVLEHTAGMLRKLDPAIRDTYAEHVSLSPQEIEMAMAVNAGAGTWYTAQEALDLGFVTDIEDLEAPEIEDDETDLSGFAEAPQEAVALYDRKHGSPPAEEDEDALAASLLAHLEDHPEALAIGPETHDPAGDAPDAEILALIAQAITEGEGAPCLT